MLNNDSLISFFLLIILFTFSTCYSQKNEINNENSSTQFNKVDSLRIYFFTKKSTSFERRCNEINDYLLNSKNSYFISITDSLRRRLFSIQESDFKQIKDYQGGIYVDAVMRQYSEYEQEWFCFSLFSGTKMFNKDNEAFEFSNTINGLINILIFNKIIDKDYECVNPNCEIINNDDLVYFLENSLRNIRRE